MTTIGLGVVLAMTSVTFSQDHPIKHKKLTKEERKNMSTEDMAKHKTDKMTKKLKLSEAQSKEVYEINLRHENEIKEMRAESKKIRAEVKLKRQAKKSEIEKVLTAEQQEKVKKMQAKRQAKHKERKAQRQAPAEVK